MGPVFIVNEARVKWTVTRFPVFIIYMCHVTITFIEVRSSEVCFIDRVMDLDVRHVFILLSEFCIEFRLVRAP